MKNIIRPHLKEAFPQRLLETIRLHFQFSYKIWFSSLILKNKKSFLILRKLFIVYYLYMI